MCGRFVLRQPRHPWLDDLPRELERSRYNIAPSQRIAAVGRDAQGRRRVRAAIWGFRPRWLAAGRRAPINARAETATSTPMFCRAFEHGRCLIPADGWYEWQAHASGPKQPHLFRRRDDALFWFAGLAASDRDGNTTAAIVTVEANEVARPVHPRMPVAFASDDAAAAWIDPAARREELASLLAPPPAEGLEAFPVSRRVNRPENDDPRCIAPTSQEGASPSSAQSD